jgi:lysophospholipase L1-like esterase
MGEIDADSSVATSPTPQRVARFSRRWLWRWCTRSVVALVTLLIVGELVARYALGLGDPPLSISHPTIEYMFKPSMTYHRFGNTVSYNAYSMRSPDFPSRKTDPNELRVMVMGDSVVNGGALTDQQSTVTSLLERALREELHRPVIVGNISAGSWGPPNLEAYANAYGWFDADVVVIVLSSHDYADAPTFEPIVGVSPDFPATRPRLAIQELVTRYLPRILPSEPAKPAVVSPAAVETCTAALHRLLRQARGAAKVVLLAQYPEKSELHGEFMTGHQVIADVAAAEGVPTLELREDLASAGSESQLYLDGIHPTALAQSRMASSFNRAILGHLRERRLSPTTGPARAR